MSIDNPQRSPEEQIAGLSKDIQHIKQDLSILDYQITILETSGKPLNDEESTRLASAKTNRAKLQVSLTTFEHQKATLQLQLKQSRLDKS